MSGPVCPSCGVAVVPGYVRCPKCQKPLPRFRAAARLEGGTAVESKGRFPVVALIAAAVLGAGVIVFLGMRSGDDQPAPRPAVVAEEADDETPVAEPTGPVSDVPAAPTGPTGPSPASVAANLERALKRQRLWSTVSVVGDRVEIRSGACSDPAMTPMLEEAEPSLKAAGLTKLRCLEQSGRVVTDRDL